MSKLDGKYDVNSDGCWIWNMSSNNTGYGQLWVDGEYWQTHRYSYFVHKGDLEKGKVVRHLCHTPLCINPEHLEQGTYKENWEDSKDKHLEARKKARKSWNIAGKIYNTVREARDATGVTMNSLVKFTCKETRIFDVDSYRASCKISNSIPKV